MDSNNASLPLPLNSTFQLTKEDKAGLYLPVESAFGFRLGLAHTYQPLPSQFAQAMDDPTVVRWRIELHGLGAAIAPLGFDLFTDVILGRGSEADIDFDLYPEQELGVSRRHALLRPSEQQLYLIDLNSTNGTRHNSMPLTNGQARALRHGDTITLGKLTFELQIIDSPVHG